MLFRALLAAGPTALRRVEGLGDLGPGTEPRNPGLPWPPDWLNLCREPRHTNPPTFGHHRAAESRGRDGLT